MTPESPNGSGQVAQSQDAKDTLTTRQGHPVVDNQNTRTVGDRGPATLENYQFIEIMCCPGGCVNGGGQPIVPASVRNNVDVRTLRAKALYSEDEAKTLRKSHDNPVLKEVYKTYLEKPGSEKAHHLLHTHYAAKNRFMGE